MTYKELTAAASAYRSAATLDGVILAYSRRRFRSLAFFGALILLVCYIASISFREFPSLSGFVPALSGFLLPTALKFWGGFLLLFALWLALFLLECFYRSYYLSDIETTLPESGWAHPPLLHFEVAASVAGQTGDPVLDFFTSSYGVLVSARLGISSEALVTFLKSRSFASADSFAVVSPEPPLGLKALAEALAAYDEPLRRFLLGFAATPKDLSGAAEWVERSEHLYKQSLRFWGKDALGRMPGVGKDWGYGETTHLERYASEVQAGSGALAASGQFGKKEVDSIERVLSRENEANVILVGEEGVPKLSIVARLAKRIASGTALPPIEHKRVFVFDGVLFATAQKEKNAFEQEFSKLLAEAVHAGNIILTLDKFSEFLESAKRLGSDALGLLEPYLRSSTIQVIAIAETGTYHQILEPNPKIKELFEKVTAESVGPDASLPALEETALGLEARAGLFFTYQAILSVAESAERYFFEGVMPDKAIDLLEELVPAMHAKKKRLVAKEDVLALVQAKTGIAVEAAGGVERERLLNLEANLHERIVGQNEAVKAISGALRRTRSGVQNPNRPLGSFLFLGPTGVGKTETTKALASVFFGDEKTILRLDMTEYQSDDALNRLIGTFEGGKAGVLSSMLREKPYGVLLLDEFEKTKKEVLDLFLQILDEGVFSDVSGKRVNARNLIIIATSNAGSDIIWKLVKEGGVSALDKDKIIGAIIDRGSFKPELLNRFDGVILFHPLNVDDLKKIARIMLEKLSKRLKEKGIELIITDQLLNFLVSVGQDPKFGARPMNRAIQDHVEQAIADKMLKGELSAGSKAELSEADFK